MKKILKNLKRKFTVLAVAIIAIQPVLVGAVMMPAKTFANTAGTEVVINEVKTGASTDNDFIELYNPTGTPFDLNGHRLVKRATAGTTDTTIKAWSVSTMIPAHGYYLWANSTYTTIAVSPDVTTTATITDNNGIALRNGSEDTGTIIDKVGWGTSTNEFVDTTAATNPSATESIERTNGDDNDVNSTDFSSNPTPTPKNSDNVAPVAPITGNISVTQNGPGTHDTVSGIVGAVEAFSVVKVYEDSALTSIIGTSAAVADGSFGPIDIGDNKADTNNLIYITSTDENGNVSGSTGMTNDITGPVITLLGVSSQSIEMGSVYTDNGATAEDEVDGDVTANIETVNPVNSSVTGTYTVTYNVKDAAGNSATQVTRTVKVVATISPVVTTVVPAVATVVVPETVVVQDDQYGGYSSDQGEVKADTTVQPDEGNKEENKDEQKEDVKEKKNIPLWGIIFLLVLAGIGGYLFYSQSPEPTTKKK